MTKHHEYCDSVGLGPDLEPSTKPCNCGIMNDEIPERQEEPACFHCDGSGRCNCPFCSPGYELVNGEMNAMTGNCIAPHERGDRRNEQK